jgi:hypothetical protein
MIVQTCSGVNVAGAPGRAASASRAVTGVSVALASQQPRKMPNRASGIGLRDGTVHIPATGPATEAQSRGGARCALIRAGSDRPDGFRAHVHRAGTPDRLEIWKPVPIGVLV